MIRLEGRIIWPDGRIQEIVVTQREWSDWELFALARGWDPRPDGPTQVTFQRYLGFAYCQRAAHVPRGEWPPFEEWSADDVDLEPPAAEDGKATPAAVPFPGERSAG